MKTIGLIGGMSWESSLEYYRIINEQVKNRLGALHSAKSLMYSVDFQEIEEVQHQGKWDEAAKSMIEAAQRLQKGGADFIVICSNTMHKVSEDVEKNMRVPLLHIADATAEKIKGAGFKKIGLLGTRFTMEEDFYKGRLIRRYGLEVIIPDKKDRRIVHNVIYKELCLGVMKPSSRDQFKEIIKNFVRNGAEGVILGCTEIPLLVKQEEVEVRLFDTTRIHAESAVEYALKW
jgi:aspartate racemase